jgi:isopropylmalate/homocitrate/citramalate synthase
VRIVEVGPRDGLQNEPGLVPTAAKVRFVEGLLAAGLRHVEVSSFVSPRAVPQLADAEDVFAALPPREGITLGALVPNERGLRRALATSAGEIALFTGATDAFTTHNIHLTVEASLERFAPLAGAARDAGRRVRGYVSVAFGCPYQGAVAASAVQDVARRLFDLGVQEVSLGDTIGVATPNQVPQVAGPLLEEFGPQRVALHLHDTRGTALANAFAGLLLGVTTFDSSAGGLGGCPYAPGAAGNLATEDLLYMLRGMGIETGVDLEAVATASRALSAVLGRSLRSRYLESTTPLP